MFLFFICFGSEQYESGVLEACLTLLQVSPQHQRDSNKDYILRTDPVYLSLVICAMVVAKARTWSETIHRIWQNLYLFFITKYDLCRNSNKLLWSFTVSYVMCVFLSKINSEGDDQGILLGKWKNDYSDGVKPTDWTSSADILQQWLSSKFKPVRYGQCWVFASVLCTGTSGIITISFLKSEHFLSAL